MASERVIMTSTTSSSLNDRFTRIMKTRKTQVKEPVTRNIRVDERGIAGTVSRMRSNMSSRQPRSVIAGGYKYPARNTVSRAQQYKNTRRTSVHHRVGRKNFPDRIPFARRMNGRVQKRQYKSFWDRNRQENYPRESRSRRSSGRFVNPLDRFTPEPSRKFNEMRSRQGFRPSQAAGFRFKRNNNRINGKYGNYGRTNRRQLDRELEGYMQKSAKYNRARLDEEMDQYMSGTKAYLDKQMDEYMSAKKKNTAIQGI
ncbi:Oidioi.mRNA.OKI2018_I69.chr1.g2259.t1.cds [Oikopleura dioica]|uniref:Oidioi.mRNA.OKI2018_I69.chr1.g2259.t1.cds n=1 Tax=Oikopleura dioica TaxID=34765 RepID=A0ABN7SQK4_OIKDI|nr:Oidioi.mRNA.OKI2018_I69.chr1.g2259.t1.cds [Oikopleura dioica]